jgi:Protein of unknown function (DUF3105)
MLRSIAAGHRRRALLLALVGVVVVVVGLGVVLLTRGDTPERIARPGGAPSTCTQTPADPPEAAGTSHLTKRFSEPGDEIDSLAVGHVLADGFVVVSYRASLDARERARLRRWVGENELAVFVIPDADQRAAVRATTRERVATCTTVDLGGLSTFRDTWLRDVIRGRQGEQG